MSTPGDANQQYSFAQLESLWIQAGGPAAWAPVMAAVALAESTGAAAEVNLSDINGGSYGLWQINGSHAGINSKTPPTSGGPQPSKAWVSNVTVPINNAKEAVALFNAAQAAGESPLYPWQGDAAVKSFGLVTAPPSLNDAVTWTMHHFQGSPGFLNFLLTGALNPPPATVPNQGQPANQNTQDPGAAVPGIGVNLPWTGVIGDIEKAFSDLLSPTWWTRVGTGALGVALIAAGLWIFLGTTQEGQKAESVIAGATPARALA